MGDDGFEANNSLEAAKTLNISSPVNLADLVSIDADYFKFTVASLGSVDVTIQFWNAANDLDLSVYDSGGNLVWEARVATTSNGSS